MKSKRGPLPQIPEADAMIEIAHGVDVYFENKKNFQNVILLPNGKVVFRPAGGMLFEVMSDANYDLAITKCENMIRIYPGYHDPLSPQTLTDGFNWLYGAVQDEDADLSVATELFRSGFSDAIHRVLSESKPLDTFPCVGVFLESCHAVLVQDLGTFAAYFDALAARDSGIDDEDQGELAEEFMDFADEMKDIYTRKLSVRRKFDGREVEFLNISGYIQLLAFEYCQMRKKNKVIKICANCGRYFIPPKRRDSIYCQAPAPDDPSRTCQEVGSNRKQAKRIKTDANERLHHQVTSQIGMMRMRARDRGEEELVRQRYHIALEKEKQRYYEAKGENN